MREKVRDVTITDEMDIFRNPQQGMIILPVLKLYKCVCLCVFTACRWMEALVVTRCGTYLELLLKALSRASLQFQYSGLTLIR